MTSGTVVVGVALSLVLAGLSAIAATRNMLKVVMGLQSMILGCLLLLAYACSASAAEDIFVIIATATAATEALAMAVTILVWERFKTIDPQKVSELRW